MFDRLSMMLSGHHSGSRHCVCQVILLLFAALTSTLVPATQPDDHLILGVHPYLSHSELQVRFQPLARYLEEELGRPVMIRVGRDYSEHVEKVGRDEIDIAYVGPVSFLRLVENHGSKPLLAKLQRDGRAVLDGHLVVRHGSDIQRLDDLVGRTLGFGDPNSTMSSVVPIAVLGANGVRLEDLASYSRYRGHSNIAMAVLSGQVDAGAVKSEVFERFKADGLRSLLRLPEVSEHLFLARADMAPSLVDKVREALLELGKSEKGLRALRSIHPQASALVPVSEADYDNLRELLRR